MAGIPRTAVDDVLLHGPATVAQIAETLGADVESVQDILDDMADAGDVERLRNGPSCVYRLVVTATPEEAEEFLAAAWRRRIEGPGVADDFDAMLAQIERLAETGGTYPSD